MIVVQMHGEPGSGKSTLAKGIGRKLPAVVIDKDGIASAMVELGVEMNTASRAAYQAMYNLAGDMLAADYSVVLDSPCYYPIIEATGRDLAERYSARWAMVECVCPPEVVVERLRLRAARAGQPLERIVGLREGAYEPTCPRLTLDTTQPAEALVAEAVSYLRGELLAWHA